MLKKSDLLYDLPEELIAQYPPKKRGTCRLMVVNRSDQSITETDFGSFSEYLTPSDILVLNNTRVINARLKGTRASTGGAVELLLLEKTKENTWKVMIRPGKRCRKGNSFCFSQRLSATVLKELGEGRAMVSFTSDENTEELLNALGSVPLPPYIKRPVMKADEQRYQTVFASSEGAVAAPTAGLHFTERMLSDLRSRGTQVEYITLHVGPGTFQPLREDILEENRMEEERYSVSKETAKKISDARKAGGRIAAVGTTVARTLESVNLDPPEKLAGRTDIFIYPPWMFKNVDILLTNFHLPGSSLISLVGSFAGLDLIMEAYARAVRNKYKFYSYGDAMLIL
ncbi:tRNA preQ1(34) S-adenosylmethionine ribosyltransferase-isomerase QueA [Candidatus Fermentibacteria bacterium]|nr:MAG: tRNA preQ1(34) S-adenosylmethionine ribosyltransferase-isomerase QueA [Candidatus Fermentibacteria bacterium]